jgi:hypothetical protein
MQKEVIRWLTNQCPFVWLIPLCVRNITVYVYVWAMSSEVQWHESWPTWILDCVAIDKSEVFAVGTHAGLGNFWLLFPGWTTRVQVGTYSMHPSGLCPVHLAENPPLSSLYRSPCSYLLHLLRNTSSILPPRSELEPLLSFRAQREALWRFIQSLTN